MLHSPRYRKVFLTRFISHILISFGMLVLGLIIEPVIGEEAKFKFNQLSGKKFVLPNIITSANQNPQTSPQITPTQSLRDVTLVGGSEIIVPASTDFGIVIEKINANAKVIENVNPANEAEYKQALTLGVAHARGTAVPGQIGNTYLFSHSTDAPWNIVRYNAIFYLLGKLEKDDRIIVFYKGRRYDYIVFDKTIANPSDTHFLTDTYDSSVLTLQTCDPPGTLINRLIIRARLASDGSS